MQDAYRVPHPMISSRVLAPDEAANVFPVWRRSWNRRPLMQSGLGHAFGPTR
jgi:hypothetical protein